MFALALVLAFAAGFASVIGLSALLHSKWSNRTLAVIGIIMWPFKSFTWLFTATKEQRGARKFGNHPWHTMTRILFQLRYNVPFQVAHK